MSVVFFPQQLAESPERDAPPVAKKQAINRFNLITNNADRFNDRHPSQGVSIRRLHTSYGRGGDGHEDRDDVRHIPSSWMHCATDDGRTRDPGIYYR